jgi:hypothetical protein
MVGTPTSRAPVSDSLSPPSSMHGSFFVRGETAAASKTARRSSIEPTPPSAPIRTTKTIAST